MSDDDERLIVPGDPAATMQRVLRKIVKDSRIQARQKLLRRQASPEEWERADEITRRMFGVPLVDGMGEEE